MYLKTVWGVSPFLMITVVLFKTISLSQEMHDLVAGNLIQLNDNGAWCWYQDERAVIDAENNKLIVGSIGNKSGIGGLLHDGEVNSVIFDFNTGTSERFILKSHLVSYSGGDDHNAPAFLVRPDHKYLALYAGHNNDNITFYRIYNSGIWEAENQFDWNAQKPGGVNFPSTYSNVFYLSSENRTYNFSRGHNKSPNFMISADLGDSWSYGGQLTSGSSTTYNNGYYKYWGNGIDRIDFIFTEMHPRDTTTSIYHGYIQNGQSYKSDGTPVDDNIFDATFIPTFWDFTKVFQEGMVLGGDTMRRCWNADVVRYNDGTIATIITARVNVNSGNDGSINPDHNFIYCRYNGVTWSYTFLAKAGKKLYGSEADYTGLGALCPDDPNTLYISTNYDPRDTTLDLGSREIFKGITYDNGASWTWIPITEKSIRNNYRPIVPNWDNANIAVLWFRGKYNAAQNFDAAIVGIIERNSEIVDKMNYVDASHSNTSFATGTPLVTTGPDSNKGPADGMWHERLGFGNGGSVFTSAELDSEDVPVLKTTITLSEAGTYDIWINFWANPDYDWRIEAGLDENNMKLFRQMASKQVEAGDHTEPIILTGGGNTYLYQAYLGRAQVSAGNNFEVFVDDSCIVVGTDSLTGNTTRTWYDGVSYARINSTIGVSEDENRPIEFKLSQNYPNPFNPNTTINYSLSRDAYVKLKVYNLIGQEIVTLIDKEMRAGAHKIYWDAQNISSGVYFYKINAAGNSRVLKMVLMK